MPMKSIKIPLIILFLLLPLSIKANHCSDEMLLNGYERLVAYGMDTTNNWWAVTEPVSGNYRLHVNGRQTSIFYRLTKPVFSADGTRWAAFGEDNVQRYLITELGTEVLPGTDYGVLSFSPNSRRLVYSYIDAGIEYINHNEKMIQTYQRTGDIYVSWSGKYIAYVEMRGNRKIININGKESPLYEDIIPIGFWNDDKMLYCAKSGSNWEVYKGNRSLSLSYKDIVDAKINIDGTVAAVLAVEHSGRQVGILFSDEYYEPLIGRSYDWVGGLALHPTLPLMAYKALHNGRYIIVFSSSEIDGGEQTGNPYFTHDGSHLFFFGCTFHCFVNIDGKKYDLKMQFSVDYPYAMKPGSETIAYSNDDTMIIRLINSTYMIAGKMLDSMGPPRYNWRDDQYEALGEINSRLYMLKCKY